MSTDIELADDGHDLGYSHTDGVCDNTSCRKSNPECLEEWEACETCNGKGYHKS